VATLNSRIFELLEALGMGNDQGMPVLIPPVTAPPSVEGRERRLAGIVMAVEITAVTRVVKGEPQRGARVAE